MPTINFVKNLPALEVERGSVLMPQLLNAGLPVASSCHGDGVCAKCRVHVVAGRENLSPLESLEQILRERNRLAPDVRISCQVKVLGDITIDTSYW